MRTAIYTLTSELHDEQAVNKMTQEFLESIGIDYELKGCSYADYGTHPLSLIFVRTGGTEGIFRKLLPDLLKKSQQPFRLLTSGKSNSLAASMEILSYLRQQNIEGEIIHGSSDYISQRIHLLEKVGEARQQLNGCRLGIVGKPSDWLISSNANARILKEKWGIELVEIGMNELLENIEEVPKDSCGLTAKSENIRQALPVAGQIYHALREIVEIYRLQGFTLRCFDLLTSVKNTGCLALAKLNQEGIVAGCEGDVPAMLSMIIARKLLHTSSFQANPAYIDIEKGEMLFAHCTIPLDIVDRYELDTHFESGIGVGIRGFMKQGPVTIFKVSGDLTRSFIAEGELLRCQAEPNLCRTQQVIRLSDKTQTEYFLHNPIGNHHIVLPGHCATLLKELLA